MPWLCKKCGFGNEETQICIKCGVKKSFFSPKFSHQVLSEVSTQTSSSISIGEREFQYLGGGGYTEAILCHTPLKYGISLHFRSGQLYDGPVVLRIVGDTSSGRHILENPDRVPRLFNSINENHNLPQAISFDVSRVLFQTIISALNAIPTKKWYRSWDKSERKYEFMLRRPSTKVTITPYLTGLRKATDDELAQYVLTKFIRHRRILLDAFNDDNAMMPTPACPFSVNMNDLVTLDASAFFQIFNSVEQQILSSSSSSFSSSSSSSLSMLSAVDDEADNAVSAVQLSHLWRQTFTSLYWAHPHSRRNEFTGGLSLRKWICIWQEDKKAHKIPKTKLIIISLLKLAEAKINDADVITILNRDPRDVLEWFEVLDTLHSDGAIMHYISRLL